MIATAEQSEMAPGICLAIAEQLAGSKWDLSAENLAWGRSVIKVESRQSFFFSQSML